MLLTFRNTYKNSKIMLWYCIICILSILIGVNALLISFVFPFWWMYLISVFSFAIFFFSFFLLVLKNNNYKVKNYYNKKNFNRAYVEILSKYNIDSYKDKRDLKRIAKDHFYQYGVIDEKEYPIKFIIFNNWMKKQSYLNYQDYDINHKLDFFFSRLMIITCKHELYKIILENLIIAINRDEIIDLLDKCEYIQEGYKDKCKFILDYNRFVTDDFLDEIYLETKYMIELRLGLITKEEFLDIMYNPKYQYDKNKRYGYEIKKESNIYRVYKIDLEVGLRITLSYECENEKDANEIINEDLKTCKYQ